MNPSAFFAFALALALPTVAAAQIDRECSDRVASQHLRHASLADIQTWSAAGYRLSNFEIAQPNPLQLNCTMVRNTGAYAAGWYFYADRTRAELLNLCNLNNARIVDLERYEVNGEERLAALLFVNSGAQAKNWYWHTGLAQGSVYSTVAAMGNRVIDIESYLDDGVRRYHVISIANTGADYKPWWIYTNTNVAGVQTYMAQHDARLYDFEMQSLMPYSAACVLVRDDIVSKTFWGEFYGSGFDLDTEQGGRVAGLAVQSIGSYAITLIDNMNPFLSSGIGSLGTNGTTIHSGEGTAMTGTQVTYRTQNLRPWAPVWMNYGFTSQSLSLAPMGAPGCWGYLVPVATELRFANGSGVAADTLTIPNNPSFAGLPILTQMIAMDPGVNALGIASSNRLRTLVRHW